MVNPSNNVVYKKLPVGNAGEVTRKHDSKIAPAPIKKDDSQTYNVYVGDTMAVYEGAYSLRDEETITLEKFKGFATRAFPTQVETAPFPQDAIVDILTSGYILVKLGKGNVVNGSPLALAKEDEGTENGYKKGDIVQQNTGDNKLIFLPNTWSTGEAKAGDVVEIAFNI